MPEAVYSFSSKPVITPEPVMHQTTKVLSEQAVQLPPTERMELVERILDSLDQPDTTMDALWASEADDRLAAYRRGEIRAIPLSEVLAKYQTSSAA
jgi:putative addiction module component (TIGR02574 family)